MARYEEIADDLRDRIRAGTYTGLLPGLDTLTDEYSASIGTVRRAEQRLVDEGWIRIAQGEGAYVNPTPPADDPVATARAALEEARALIDRALAALRRH